MITKKTVVEGKEVKQTFTSPLSILHNFFGTQPIQPKTVRFGTAGYREYRKKIVLEGRGSKWLSETTGREREVLGIKRLHERRNTW